MAVSRQRSPSLIVVAEELLTTRDVAQLLGISSEAVLRQWRAGELPGFLLSTRVLRFRESELMDWLEIRRGETARRVTPPPIQLHVKQRHLKG